MRFVLISDTHTLHRNLKLPNGDVLIHAGDFSWKGTESQVHDFLSWFEATNFKHKIFIAGNHDFMFENNRNLAKAMIPSNITYLEDDLIYVDNFAVYGSPWTPRFYDWAFNQDRGEVSAKRWAKIPDFVDILITHGPPMNTLDTCPDMFNPSKPVHVGCEALAERIPNLKNLKLHVFGHIHEGYGVSFKDGVQYVNAALLSDYGRMLVEPIVVDL